MNNQEIVNGLSQLGFNSGWVVTENEITLWENAEPQPTTKEISDAAKLWENTQAAEAEAKATARQAVLDKLGLSSDEIVALLA